MKGHRPNHLQIHLFPYMALNKESNFSSYWHFWAYEPFLRLMASSCRIGQLFTISSFNDYFTKNLNDYLRSIKKRLFIECVIIRMVHSIRFVIFNKFKCLKYFSIIKKLHELYIKIWRQNSKYQIIGKWLKIKTKILS